MKGPLLLAAFVTVASLAPVAARQRMSLEQLKQVAQPVGAEPIEVLELEKVWAGVEPLLRLATSRDVDIRVRNAAVRALGRLEDPRAVPSCLRCHLRRSATRRAPTPLHSPCTASTRPSIHRSCARRPPGCSTSVRARSPTATSWRL